MHHGKDDDVYKAGLPTICARNPPIVCLQGPLVAMMIPQDVGGLVKVTG